MASRQPSWLGALALGMLLSIYMATVIGALRVFYSLLGVCGWFMGSGSVDVLPAEQHLEDRGVIDPSRRPH